MWLKLILRFYLASFVVLVAFVIYLIIVDRQRYSQMTILPVERVVGNAGRALVLRFPLSIQERQEDIRIYHHNHTAVRHPVDVVAELSTSTELTSTHWRELQQIRRDWCATPPVFAWDQSDSAVFDMGLDCRGTDMRRVIVPLNMLPSPLMELIKSVPSPTCQDRLCGWASRLSRISTLP